MRARFIPSFVEGAGGGAMAAMGMMSEAAVAPWGASAHRRDAASQTGLPCDATGVPKSCQASTPCAASFVGAMAGRVPLGLVAERLPGLEVLTPVSLALPPEIPPPRA